jgi:hypothetical protein
MNFARRLGPDPHEGGQKTIGCDGCPDIWELDTGDFAIIGIEVTPELKTKLPPTASCGSDERIVLVPRRILMGAKPHIPDA